VLVAFVAALVERGCRPAGDFHGPRAPRADRTVSDEASRTAAVRRMATDPLIGADAQTPPFTNAQKKKGKDKEERKKKKEKKKKEKNKKKQKKNEKSKKKIRERL
jgi:hypothetical protein